MAFHFGHRRPKKIAQSEQPMLSRQMRQAIADAVKLLGSTQAVLIFSAGIIPEPFRIVALLPFFVLVGAAVFSVVVALMRFFQRPVGQRTSDSTPVPEPLEALAVRRIA